MTFNQDSACEIEYLSLINAIAGKAALFFSFQSLLPFKVKLIIQFAMQGCSPFEIKKVVYSATLNSLLSIAVYALSRAECTSVYFVKTFYLSLVVFLSRGL